LLVFDPILNRKSKIVGFVHRIMRYKEHNYHAIHFSKTNKQREV